MNQVNHPAQLTPEEQIAIRLQETTANLESAVYHPFPAIPHTFIPTEQVARGAVLATERRVHSLRSLRQKYAQAALDAWRLFEETLTSERKAMWTLSKQKEDFRAKEQLAISYRSSPFSAVITDFVFSF